MIAKLFDISKTFDEKIKILKEIGIEELLKKLTKVKEKDTSVPIALNWEFNMQPLIAAILEKNKIPFKTYVIDESKYEYEEITTITEDFNYIKEKIKHILNFCNEKKLMEYIAKNSKLMQGANNPEEWNRFSKYVDYKTSEKCFRDSNSSNSDREYSSSFENEKILSSSPLERF
ncbi:MAG: hypothetical protein J0H68_02305 [Sphingobacteriia bacterium]|nr:hypothetical protein [Sphingobacteriia bacterium]